MIYEYRCEECKKEFEQERSISDTTQPQCPLCKSGATQRLISASTFALKGDGWAKDGYAKKW